MGDTIGKLIGIEAPKGPTKLEKQTQKQQMVMSNRERMQAKVAADAAAATGSAKQDLGFKKNKLGG